MRVPFKGRGQFLFNSKETLRAAEFQRRNVERERERDFVYLLPKRIGNGTRLNRHDFLGSADIPT